MPNHAELLDLLLKNRGIDPVDYEKFLNPSYDKHLYNPYLLKDMDKSVSRIFKAIESKEKIVIYSDYDCDGIPAAVMMHDFFKKINYENFSIYIPDRHDEGYGLHMDAIENFIKQKINLLITFDLGITAFEEVIQATSAGIDVIVTDHHLPQGKVPEAYAVINPKQDGCLYPDKMICGAGIAYKLICALVEKHGEFWKINKGWEKWLLDMAGVATLSDQVPLLDENRVIAYYGLKVLQKGRRPGLVELFKKAGVELKKLNEEDITFTLAPRLNAASRMSDPMDAFNVLSTIDILQAKVLADNLAKINDDRKQTVSHIMKDVKKTLSSRTEIENKTIIVIGNPKWRIGILGIIAAKIVEEQKKPVFVWGSDGNDVIKGSCRSYGNINLVDLMTYMPEGSFLGFGGHSGAGGFSVSHDEIYYLEERLLQAFNKLPTVKDSEEKSNVEAKITVDDVTNENYNVIEKLAPYGAGNPKPIFLFEKIKVVKIKEFGKEKNHLELCFMNSRGREIKAIAFFKTRESYQREIKLDNLINLTATFEKSTFAGRTELRLRIVDVVF